jgi:hypothetical protein
MSEIGETKHRADENEGKKEINKDILNGSVV